MFLKKLLVGFIFSFQITFAQLPIISPGVTYSTNDVIMPANSGWTSVKQSPYNCFGDGVHDDTNCLRAAIIGAHNITGYQPDGNRRQTVYVPQGTYLISNTLWWNSDQTPGTSGWFAYLRIIGQNKANTIFKLKDNTFTNTSCNIGGDNWPVCPPMLYTAAAQFGGRPSGFGNTAYWNDVQNITFDLGNGNPGAQAVVWMASNRAALQNVNIISEDGQGKAGLNISMSALGGGNGPGYINNVLISGFKFGIYDAGNTAQYGITIDTLDELNQSVAGIYGGGTPIWIHKYASNNSVPAVVDCSGNGTIGGAQGCPRNDNGLVVLSDANLGGGSGSSAIIEENVGTGTFLRNVITSGYANALATGHSDTPIPGTTITEYSSISPINPGGNPAFSYNLGWQETPNLQDFNLGTSTILSNGFSAANCSNMSGTGSGDWVDVTCPAFAGGAFRNSTTDSTAAFNAAASSGKPVVYIPWGYYQLNGVVHFPNSVREVLCNGSWITNNVSNALSFESNSGNSVELRDCQFPNSTGHAPSIINPGTSPLALVGQMGNYGGYTESASSHDVYFEDWAVPEPWTINGSHVYARQLNIEGSYINITNGRVNILGYKTEGTNNYLFHGLGGGNAEILGAYHLAGGTPAQPVEYLFTNQNASFEGVRSSGTWNPNVREIKGATTYNTTSSQYSLYVGNATHNAIVPPTFGIPSFTSSIMLSPTAPTATVGNSVTITSNTPVTWSLSGQGTLSSQTATSVVYTAPSSVVPQQTMAGCSVLPPDSVFSTRIDNLPLNTFSSNWTALISGNLTLLPSWGTTIVDSSTPIYTLYPYYGDGVSSGQPGYDTPYPGFYAAKTEDGSLVSPVIGGGSGSDHHVMEVNKDDCSFYEFYNARISLTGGPFSYTFNCANTGSNCSISSEIPPYNSTKFEIPSTSTDAAGLILSGLVWDLNDIKNGIKHAVRFTQSSEQGCIWPSAIFSPTGNACSTTTVNGTNIPYGARFRLKTQAQGGPNITTVCGTNQPCINMLIGLQQYGMILADIGQGDQLEISSDAWKDPLVRSAITLIDNFHLTGSSFVAVDESSFEQTVANNFQQLGSYGSWAIDPGNGFETPSNYALISATSGSSTTKISVALQGIGIGLNSNTLTIAQGISGYQIPSWVEPSSVSQVVNWTISSETCSGDSVTSGGFYIPPVSGAPCNTVLEATASADSNIHAFLYVQTFAGTGGNYSIDIGSTSVTTSPGKTWYPDFGLEATTPSQIVDYPIWGGSESTQFSSITYNGGGGGDLHYCIVVPNGNYKVRVGQGLSWNGDNPPQGSVPYPFNTSDTPEVITVNDLPVAHLFDFLWANGNQRGTPSNVFVPAKVTNNLLCTGLFSTLPDNPITLSSGLAPIYVNLNATTQLSPHLTGGCSANCIKGTTLSLLEFSLDGSSPHWSIESQQATNVVPGQYLQLYVQDWYTGDPDVSSPIWSVTQTPVGCSASITSSGLFHMTGTCNGLQPITITATGASHSASITLNSYNNPIPIL